MLQTDRELRSQDVLEWLQKAIEQDGVPEYIRSDKGSELIVHMVQRWLKQPRIKTIHIKRGGP